MPHAFKYLIWWIFDGEMFPVQKGHWTQRLKFMGSGGSLGASAKESSQSNISCREVVGTHAHMVKCKVIRVNTHTTIYT